ncbi:MAG TPA: hypothetical protein PLV68_16960, partial [Ilumatobacteraceae bacterium]|nr:hypothetical protein [Ilumatobacteraceae bacterium]
MCGIDRKFGQKTRPQGRDVRQSQGPGYTGRQFLRRQPRRRVGDRRLADGADVTHLALDALIGPAVDRFRHRQQFVATACYLIRGLFCVAMSLTLYQLSFYGFALGLLIAGKASGIVKQALIPSLVRDPSRLVATNARLGRTASIVGAIGASAGLALQQSVLDTRGLL